MSSDELSDISQSPAFLILEQLLKNDKLTVAETNAYKKAYSLLHNAVIATYTNERVLLAKAKQMKALLESEHAGLEKRSKQAQASHLETEALERQDKQLHDVLDETQEANEVEKLKLESLQQQQSTTERVLNERQAQSLAQLQGPKDALLHVIADIQPSIKKTQEEIELHTADLKKFADDIAASEALIAQLEKDKAKRALEHSSALHKPDRLQSDMKMIENLMKERQEDSDNKKATLTSIERQISQQEAAKAAILDAQAKLKAKIDRVADDIDKKQEALEELKRQKEVERDEADKMLESKREQEHIMEEANELLKRQWTVINEYHKEYQAKKKMHERLRRKRDTVLSVMPPLLDQVQATVEQLEELKKTKADRAKLVQELENDMQQLTQQSAKQESLNEAEMAEIKAARTTRIQVEATLKDLDKRERKLQQELSRLTLMRESQAREVAKITSAVRQAKEDVKTKNLILMDLDKQTYETFHRLRISQQKYEKMKNQRNVFAQLNQTHSQMLAELKEKTRVRQSEVTVLRQESLTRDRVWADEQRKLAAAKNQKAAATVEKDKKTAQLATIKEEEQSQENQTEKLSSIVNQAEDQMQKLRVDYAKAVDNRNLTGIQLIDRNDELVILYEKANLQDQMLRAGEEELRKRQEEIKAVQLDITDIRRKLEGVRRRMPSAETYTSTRKTLSLLEAELERERTSTVEMIAKMETPMLETDGSPDAATSRAKDGEFGNATRTRMLGGSDPDPEELSAKIKALEQRLEAKRGDLLEKDLAVTELTVMNQKLRSQAAETRATSLELAQKIGDTTVRVRAATDAVKGVVSELSIYQAQSMQMEQRRADLEASLLQGHRLFRQGQAPFPEAEHEWVKRERDQALRHAAVVARSELQEEHLRPDPFRTTAEPRVTHYPDLQEEGMPKPYGGAAPFKPTVHGAQMRHFRRPNPKPVQL